MIRNKNIGPCCCYEVLSLTLLEEFVVALVTHLLFFLSGQDSDNGVAYSKVLNK